MQADAEGVTKRVTVTVTGARSEDDAVVCARAIARDSLVKTALFGSDPNWGRVLAAVGIAPVALDPNRISVSFNGSPVCVDGVGAPGARDVDLSGADIVVTVDLGLGAGIGEHPHHRPVACLRRRELGVQLMSLHDPDQGLGSRRGTAVAQTTARQASSSSSTAATR